jgi:hypothetical protein
MQEIDREEAVAAKKWRAEYKRAQRNKEVKVEMAVRQTTLPWCGDRCCVHLIRVPRKRRGSLRPSVRVVRTGGFGVLVAWCRSPFGCDVVRR